MNGTRAQACFTLPALLGFGINGRDLVNPWQGEARSVYTELVLVGW